MNLDDAIAQYVSNAQGMLKGSAGNFAQPGEYVWVQLQGGRTIRCRAGGVINSTQVSVVLTDSGEGFAFCETTPKVVRSAVQRWVKSRPLEVEAIGKIMYAYTTTGDAPDTTALYVAGFQYKVSIKVDEWSNKTIQSGENAGEIAQSLKTCCLDNLGAGNFIVSYLIVDQTGSLTGTGDPDVYTFKCAQNTNTIFSFTTNSTEINSLAGGGQGGNPTSGQVGFFIGSVGFGNWVTDKLRDIAVQSSSGGNSSTTLTTSQARLLSALSVNPKVGQALTNSNYTITTVSTSLPGGGITYSVSGSYTSYLSPTTTTPASYTGYGIDPSFGATNFGNFYQAVRYNANLDKGLFCYADYGAGLFGLGIAQNGSISKTPFVDFTNAALPPLANYLCTVALTSGSATATVTSGVAPPLGSAVNCRFIPAGVANVISVSGSSVTLSKNATATTTGVKLFWAFPSPQWNTRYVSNTPYSAWNSFTGTDLQCDLQADGLTIVYFRDFVARYGGSNDISTKSIQTPVSFYGNDFSYQKTELTTIYPPGIVKGTPSSQSSFLIFAASYHP